MNIFLGYPSEREVEARTIFEFLKSLGLEVWFDKESVLPGEEWRSAREKAQDAADLIVHVISLEVLSRPGEVQRELKRTLDLAEERPFGTIFLIPVLIAGVTAPVEIAKYQYVEFERPDWAYRIAKSVSRKFEQENRSVPDQLSNYLNAESAAGGRIDFKIHDVTPARDLQADYFKYRSNERYFDYVNAKIADHVLSGYYEWRRNERAIPEEETQCSTWHCQVSEFFKRDELLSIQIDYFTYWMGAAHGNTGTVGLNFAGEEIGAFSLSELFDRDLEALKYLIGYVQLGLRQQLLAIGENEPNFLCDFDNCTKEPEEGWRLLDNFTFDERGLVIHFNPYDVTAFAYGGFQVRLDWIHVYDRLVEEFKVALASVLPSLDR